MDVSQLELIEKWQSSPSFINWATGADPVDVDKWNTYFQKHPEQAELGELAKAGLLLLSVSPSTSPTDKSRSEAALRALHQKIAQAPEKNNSGKRKLIRTLANWRIAAAIVLLVGLCPWLFLTGGNGQEIIRQATAYEKMDLLLPDGTEIILNKNARLSYFEEDVRTVYLSGEAYFKVSKQPTTKATFSVITNDLVVKVLGTAFNVKTDLDHTTVFLDEGRVRLAPAGDETKSLELAPGDLVSYSGSRDSIMEKGRGNALENTAWKETIIPFHDATLTEVLAIISSVYGIQIEVAPEINQEDTSTGGIPTDNLEIALETIKSIYGLSVQKIEAKYQLKQQ